MATLNVQNLLVEINKKIVQTSDNEELLMLSKAVSVLKTGAIFTVGTFANLPDASDNVGKLYFVENDGILYFSVVSTYNNIEYWVPITTGLEINTLWSWGRNNYGVLGNGYVSARSCPGTTAGCGTNWRQVSGLACHTAAIKTDGTLWTWGYNGQGRLGDGTTVSRRSPGTVAGGGTNWCQVSVGGQNTSAIKTDGTLWTWGYNNVGRLGDGTTIARCSPGTVAGGGAWFRVSNGSAHTAAIKTDGTLWTWGINNFGQLGDGTTIIRSSPVTVVGGGTNWCFVSAGGDNFTAAIKNDGTLWTWGRNTCGGLGDGTAVDKSCPGTIAGGGTNWCWVSGFACHMGAIKCDGTLWTWGRNACILGDGTTTCRSSPGTTAGCGTNWCQISVGCCHVGAIKTDGTLWTWGCNLAGSLGDGTVGGRNSPGTIAGGGTTWCQVSASGYNFTAAIQRETL